MTTTACYTYKFTRHLTSISSDTRIRVGTNEKHIYIAGIPKPNHDILNPTMQWICTKLTDS